MDPYERLDLWQYLHGVANRLALVERALGWEEPEGYSASRPRTVDITARRRARRARTRRRVWGSGVEESAGGGGPGEDLWLGPGPGRRAPTLCEAPAGR